MVIDFKSRLGRAIIVAYWDRSDSRWDVTEWLDSVGFSGITRSSLDQANYRMIVTEAVYTMLCLKYAQ